TTTLADLDLPAADINTLANLADGEGRTVGALATATATKPSTLTSLLDRLTRRGYLVRETGPADRRSFVVRLTPDGLAVAPRAATASTSISPFSRCSGTERTWPRTRSPAGSGTSRPTSAPRRSSTPRSPGPGRRSSRTTWPPPRPALTSPASPTDIPHCWTS